jgi:hypothetical protein
MIRKGSLEGLDECDAQLVQMALEDYLIARRRERASRSDFVAGWLAASRRFGDGSIAEAREVRSDLSEDLTVAA